MGTHSFGSGASAKSSGSRGTWVKSTSAISSSVSMTWSCATTVGAPEVLSSSTRSAVGSFGAGSSKLPPSAQPPQAQTSPWIGKDSPLSRVMVTSVTVPLLVQAPVAVAVCTLSTSGRSGLKSNLGSRVIS